MAITDHKCVKCAASATLISGVEQDWCDDCDVPPGRCPMCGGDLQKTEADAEDGNETG